MSTLTDQAGRLRSRPGPLFPLCMAVALAIATGCGSVANDDFEGQALFELRGAVASAGLTETLVSPRAAVLWRAELDDSGQGVPTFARIAAEVDVVTPFPAEFRLELFDAPPAAAFGEAQLAEGQLVIYDDRNSDGRLNFFDIGEEPTDRVLGDNRRAMGEETYLIYFPEAGTNPTVERVQQRICPGTGELIWSQGFNLYEFAADASCAFGLRVAIVAPDTTIAVPAGDSADQDLMCEVVPKEAFEVVEVEFDGTYPDLEANEWRCDGTVLRVNISDRPGHPCEDYATVQQVMSPPEPLPADWPCTASSMR